MPQKIIPEYFADTTINLSLTSGMVRIDFGSVQTDPTNPQADPELLPCHRLIMPLNGFLKMFGDLNGMVQKLEQNGVLGRTQQPAQMPQNPQNPQPAANMASDFRLDSRGLPESGAKK